MRAVFEMKYEQGLHSESPEIDRADLRRQIERRRRRVVKETREPAAYRFALGWETITLGQVEFRIMAHLASRPYHAFSRRSIAEAATTSRLAVDESEIDRYIASLRDQLGCFHDYVQTVPHLGYRFKE